MLSRMEIVKKFIDGAKKISYVNACWELGAIAFDRVDDYSDIDFVIDVNDDFIMDAFKKFDKIIDSISEIDCTFESPNNIVPGAYQKVYKLKDASEFHVIEICCIPNSAKSKAVEKEIHNNILLHFDKIGVLKDELLHVDIEEFSKKMQNTYNKYCSYFEVYQFLIKKEIHRNQPMEGISYYRSVVLSPLTMLLKIKYIPFRYNFGSRYLYYELPKDICSKLEELYFVKDLKDLERKQQAAYNWYIELKEEIDKLDFKEHLELFYNNNFVK